ncbi:MAG: DUF1031 family protein [Candidatus Cloacimonetes bacterium]|nr:DUF1031 family protein [Candidatus Cloacimonadota bacterium]
MTGGMGLLDLALILARHKKLIIIITMLIALAAIVYSLLAPKYWKSTASLMPVVESNALGSISTNLLDLVGGGMMSTPKSELAVDFISVMKSRGFSEDVIRHFELIKYFEITAEDSLEAMELATEKLLGSLINVSFDQENNLVFITAETKSRQMSREIVQYYLDSLESYNLGSRMSKGRLRRQFLEKQVNTNMAEADSLARALRDFEKTNKAIALDQQTEALVNLYSESAAKMMEAEIEYELAKTQYAATSPNVVLLADKLKLLRQKVKDLESNGSGLNPSYIIGIDKVPDLSLQYAQLMINVEIKKKVIEYLYPQFELAKLDELKDLPTFEVLDQPGMAGFRSKPKRAIIVVLSTVAAFILACVIALICESLFIVNKDQTGKIIQTLLGTNKHTTD